ncbi:TIGR02680 family protein [Streptomyces sp. NBC_01003]|uniref:TIGR02680 family protein n=1 Tax=Streptomyces sp. NBC_01003 TaxID=2903714 RepID=UPI00386BABCB|nr:TIGR02680 family protein [Streptomyces sp. NBC_01003]
MTDGLPRPHRSRWQPLRIGLVDLFHYDTEEFAFRDGRLLLRGNNGTGKSKVLALTLPFLLDGDLHPRRVEPDGDPGKRMEWNLLLGGQHPHPERLGYTWIEFGRRDDATGEEHFRTLACGLKAVAGRGIARHWYAVTDQRVGAGFGFLDATGTALSRDRLAEAVAGHGAVYDQAKVYRRAVDEALFGLGEQRYAALVDLLIQLRQPQLSKRPSEAALSKALTEALPPMDQAVVTDAAEAFRSLDDEQEELRAATEAERAANRFLEYYRRYARVAARRRARLPRAEHSQYESLHRDLAQAQHERAEQLQRREAAQARLVALGEHEARLRAQDAALREGPEMRDARALEQAAEGARRTAGDQTRAESDRDQAAQRHTRLLSRRTAAERTEESARTRATQAEDAVREAAGAARVVLPDPPQTEEAAEAVARRRRTLDHVTALADEAERRDSARREAARRADEAAADLAHAQDDQARAEDTRADSARALLDAVREQAGICRELTWTAPEALLDSLQEWTRTLSGPYPVRAQAGAAHAACSADLADTRAHLTQRAQVLTGRRDELRLEWEELEQGQVHAPRPPHTRNPSVRQATPGAPLWRLIDFRDDAEAATRAGVEAALEASGLLDAWVTPGGALLGPGRHDTVLDPASSPRPAGPCLDSVVRPAVDPGDERARAVDELRVLEILEAIGYAASADGGLPAYGTWIAADGRFRVGVLTGRWAKPAAEYIGAGAREAARRQRMTAVAAELTAIKGKLGELQLGVEAVDGRRRTLDAELAAVPDDAPLRAEHTRVTGAARAMVRASERHQERAEQAAEAAAHAAEARVELTESADAVRLPADRPGLAAVRDALAVLGAALAALWPVRRELSEAERTLGREGEEADHAGRQVAELSARAAEAVRRAVAADERHTTLRDTVGSAVAELERRLADTARALTECDAEQDRADTEIRTAIDAAGRATGRIEQLEADVASATERRADAIAALQRFTGTGLLAVAAPDLDVPPLESGPWATTPAIALARAAEVALSGTDDTDAAWERVQKRLSEELTALQNALSRHGHSATARMVEDGMVVDIVYQARPRAVPELAEALATEVAELTRILSAHEREILETHLITEVAGTLQELIGQAEHHVAAMNLELEQRPTSTGMRLRLVWRPSRKRAPTGLARIRKLLLQSADAWSTEDRAAVGVFLQEQIAQQQSADDSGNWLEHLTAALDYRAWHEFGIERHQHGAWVPATGPASGGERVLAVSVPLFAAASSHYATAANPYAPRLVTLDEAFAGVDDDSRAKCLGLLSAFDLDVVMTSEREWACYPEVPGIAIAQLSRVDDIAAVLVTRWEWDGAARIRPQRPAPALEAR